MLFLKSYRSIKIFLIQTSWVSQLMCKIVVNTIVSECLCSVCAGLVRCRARIVRAGPGHTPDIAPSLSHSGPEHEL